MANNEHLAVLKKGVAAWNHRFARTSEPADLAGIALPRGDYRGVQFVEAQLSGAILSYSSFISADFTIANLSGANLINSGLDGARFAQTDLRKADLKNANLSYAAFERAALDHANLSGAVIGNTVFADVDLRTVQGLESIEHDGPSTIGIDTIYRSQGKIPDTFLRGCGVPETLIRYIPALINSEEGIQFYSCFISYSTKDEGFARRLHGRMRDSHLRVWFAREDVQGGKKLHEQIEAAIRVYDKLLIVLSESSLQSEWVMDEVRKGFKAERDTGKRKLFPVRLVDYETLEGWVCRDSNSGKDLAEEVRQYFIPDFSHWKEHDHFEVAFSRLLKDLRAEHKAA